MADAKHPPKDIAILSGPTEDGQGARVLRIREGGDVTAGEIRPVRDGEPINQSELVRLHPLDAQKRVCAVEVLHAPKPRPKSEAQQDAKPQDSRKVAAPEGKRSAGPARVSNEKYRQNWSAIFDVPGNRDDWKVN